MDHHALATTAASSHASPPSPHPLLSPPIPLSVRTSSRNALSKTRHGDALASSFPSTPPPPKVRRSKDRAEQPLRRSATSVREQSRRPRSAEVYNSRQSHGLSWSSTTKDSVVDDMLLSLNHLSGRKDLSYTDDVHDDEFEQTKRRLPRISQLPRFPISSPIPRMRGHTNTSSLSSSYDGYASGSVGDSSSSKHSLTQGRRSNSSSNVGVQHTVRGRPHPVRNRSFRLSSDTSSQLGSHGKSPSSDMDSVDTGSRRLTERNRRQNWQCRRSMSMDHLYSQQQSQTGPSILDRGRPVPSLYSKYESDQDAAPEPGIPAGPRKQQNPGGTGPVYVDQPSTKATALRKTNTHSDLRFANQPNPPIPQHIQEQASDFVRANNVRGAPQMPVHNTPAPFPGGQTAGHKNTPSPHRERPGFFKRFFGPGSRSVSGLSHSSDPSEPLGYLDKAAPPLREPPKAPHDEVPAPRTETPATSNGSVSHRPPPLTKKSSSFFRRRKKSASEDVTPPPPLPLSLQQRLGAPVQPTSMQTSVSVSSLRQVMDPYLNGESTPKGNMPEGKLEEHSRPTTGESATGDSDSLDMFHSGYTSPPEASFAGRGPLRRYASARGRVSQDQSDESPRAKMKVRKRRPDVLELERMQIADSLLQGTIRGSLQAATRSSHSHPLEPSEVSPMAESTPKADENERPVSRASTGDRIIAAKEMHSPQTIDNMRNFSADTNLSLDVMDHRWNFARPPNPVSSDEPGSPMVIVSTTETEAENTGGVGPPRHIHLSANSSQPASGVSPYLHQESFASAMQSPGLASVYHSATSSPLASVQWEGDEAPRPSFGTRDMSPSSTLVDEDAEYRERARKIFEGHEEDVTHNEAASWLGERNHLNTRTLIAYMRLFDFAGLNLLSALRRLCGKLLLRGETQQFDRIITELSARWCECNPNHGFKAQDVVHTIFYSLILLNTDLHLADIGEKMSRSAYVKNTLPTVRRVVSDAAPHAFDDKTAKPTAHMSRPSLPWVDSNNTSGSASPPNALPDPPNERISFEVLRPPPTHKRLSLRPGMLRAESDGWAPDSAGNAAGTALVHNAWTGGLRGWEFEIETLLKSFYASIRDAPLPLLGAPEPGIGARNMTATSLGGLKRSGSVASRTPSDNPSYRSKTGWQGRYNRTRAKVYQASTLGVSRTSFDDNSSVWSLAQSSTWSKTSFANTMTSASMSNLGHHLMPTASDYKRSIGFANALSQAIIREETLGGPHADAESVSVPAGLLEDEALALEGAPWAKEGLVKHKHHLESPDRKAKERSWSDCFAVIGQGKLTLFAFNTAPKNHTMMSLSLIHI